MSKDPELHERYADTIRQVNRKGYVVTVQPHDVHKHSDCVWYLPCYPVLNTKKPAKVRRVLHVASMFHGTSLKSPYGWVQTYPIINVCTFAIPSIQVRRLRGYRGCVAPGRSAIKL